MRPLADDPGVNYAKHNTLRNAIDSSEVYLSEQIHTHVSKMLHPKTTRGQNMTKEVLALQNSLFTPYRIVNTW